MAKYCMAETLELVHGDLCGPITPTTDGGRKYFILLVDDCRRFMWLQLLTSKTEAAEAVKKFKARAEAGSDKKLRVQTDRGGEFTSVEFATYCADQGVVRHHHAVLATAEWRGGEAQPDSGRHGEVDDEG